MKAVRAVVGGRVQGVGFRYSTVDQANRHGVTGWVRNMPSGQVEVFVQGPDVNVDELSIARGWVDEGPGWCQTAGFGSLAQPLTDLGIADGSHIVRTHTDGVVDRFEELHVPAVEPRSIRPCVVRDVHAIPLAM